MAQFEHADLIHSLLWSGCAIGLSGFFAAGLIDVPAHESQLKILAIGTLIFGVCHGALDWEVGRSVLNDAPWWGLKFAFGYLGMVVLALYLWQLDRTLVLVLFLLASAVHFGSAPCYVRHNFPQMTVFVSAFVGSLTILVPWLTNQTEFDYVFDQLGYSGLTPGHVAQIMASSRPAKEAALFLLVVALAIVPHGISSLPKKRLALARPDAAWLIEIISLILLFSTTPPILAFTLFFCGLHSIRHVLELSAQLWRGPLGISICQSLIYPLPVTVLTVVGSILFYFSSTGENVETRTVTLFFGGLAALTFPHMVLNLIYPRLTDTQHF